MIQTGFQLWHWCPRRRAWIPGTLFPRDLARALAERHEQGGSLQRAGERPECPPPDPVGPGDCRREAARRRARR
jgi:hypothetical protein